MKLTKPLLGITGGLGSSIGAWQSYEGGVPSNHSLLTSEGYQWSLPDSKYEHPITLPETGNNRKGFKSSGCYERFFKEEVKFEAPEDQKSTDPLGADSFSDAGDENVQGCFLGDVRYRTRDKQKAISLKTELALRKGNHGLAVWTILSSLEKNGPAPDEEIRIIRLSKEGGTWRVKKGYSLSTVTNHLSGRYSQLKVTFKGENIFEWKGQAPEMCKSSANSGTSAVCEDWSSWDPRFRWFDFFEGGDQGSEKIFGRLVVEDPGVSEQQYKHAFWIPGDKNGWTDSLGWKGIKGIYDTTDNLWKTPPHADTYVYDDLPVWFKVFMEAKGTWHDGNTWCKQQSNIRDGSPSTLFKEICYKK